MELFNALHEKHTGFHRCIRITTRTVNGIAENQFRIERYYFVDVLTSIPVIIREAEEDEPKLSNLPSFSTNLIEPQWIISKWGDCNRCGEDVIGEQRRKIECMVMVSIFLDK